MRSVRTHNFMIIYGILTNGFSQMKRISTTFSLKAEKENRRKGGYFYATFLFFSGIMESQSNWWSIKCKYTEIFVFVSVFIFLVFLPVGKDILVIRIIGILNTIMTFVIQPLFYLNGDVNFQNRVLHKGLWLAIKTELFWIPHIAGPGS